MKESGSSTSRDPHRWSSGRRRLSTSSISTVKNVSSHPSSHPVDATRLSVVRIAQKVPNKSSSFMTCLDFVNMSDNNLDILFVGDRARSRQRVLLYPPKHHRRTAKQIKHWFNILGVSDKKREMDLASVYQILKQTLDKLQLRLQITLFR